MDGTCVEPNPVSSDDSEIPRQIIVNPAVVALLEALLALSKKQSFEELLHLAKIPQLMVSRSNANSNEPSAKPEETAKPDTPIQAEIKPELPDTPETLETSGQVFGEHSSTQKFMRLRVRMTRASSRNCPQRFAKKLNTVFGVIASTSNNTASFGSPGGY